jgi:hypothetical protein
MIDGGQLQIYVNGVTSGETTNYFASQTIDNTKLIRFDLGSAKIIDEAKYYHQDASAQGVWQWQGSNTEGSGYVNIGGTFSLGGATETTMTELNGNTTQYRYYQMVGVSGTTNGNNYGYEFEFKVEA